MPQGQCLTTDFVKNRLRTLGLELLSECSGSKEKIVVRCSCGKEFITIYNRIHTGNTRSCGCLLKRFLTRKMYEGISGTYWNHIIHGAKKRGIEFSITKEYAATLFKNQDGICALSGQDIWFISNYKDTTKQTASLDRIDSSKGYIEGNVQWVHKNINKLKGSMNDLDFVKLCGKVSSYNSYDGKFQV